MQNGHNSIKIYTKQNLVVVLILIADWNWFG